MNQLSSAPSYVFYQTHTAVFSRWLNDAGDVLQRFAQGLGGIFNTIKYAQMMQGQSYMSASITAKEISIVEAGLSVFRLFCDILQLPSGDLFFEIASKDEEVTVKSGQKIEVKQGQIAIGEDGNRVWRPWIHSVAKIGSVVGRVLGTMNFFHERAFRLSNPTFTNLSTVALVNGFITAGAWLGTAALFAFRYAKDATSHSMEKTAFHVIACIRSVLDVVSVTFDTATRHLASNPSIGLASAAISMTGGLVWFGSEMATYKRSW